MKSNLIPLTIFLSVMAFTGCTDKQEEDFTVEKAADYFQLTPGKFIIYRVDSTVFAQQGRVEEKHVYQQKDVIGAQTTDGLGRTSYIVYRYIRDSAGTQPWSSLGTYYITPTLTGVEVTEDNMRVIRLASPVKEGTAWKGNSFLATEPYFTKFPSNFGNDDNMNDWRFVISSTGESVTLNGKTFTDVATVKQVDERNYPDTITVANNQAQIGATVQSVWLIGTATDTIILSPVTPRSGSLAIYNRTNKYAKIANLATEPGKGRFFEYINSNWRYANNKDTFYTEPPYAFKNFGLEKYAKGKGLIYQELVMWEFQPNPGSTPFKVGFGIKRTLLDNN